MKIIYREEDYYFVPTDYTSPGFKHFYLLFIREGGSRKAYSVQMAVNYISTLTTATIDQEIDEQTFVACIPMSEYPEVLEFLDNDCREIDIYSLCDNLANNLIAELIKLLNSNRDGNSKVLMHKTEKLSQYLRLLELENIEKPLSTYEYDDLYHTYLTKQRIFTDSLKNKMRLRKSIHDIEYLLFRPNNSYEYVTEISQKFKALIELKDSIKNKKYAWFDDIENELKIIKMKIGIFK